MIGYRHVLDTARWGLNICNTQHRDRGSRRHNTYFELQRQREGPIDHAHAKHHAAATHRFCCRRDLPREPGLFSPQPTTSTSPVVCLPKFICETDTRLQLITAVNCHCRLLNIGSIRIYILTTGVVSNETNTYVRMYIEEFILVDLNTLELNIELNCTRNWTRNWTELN